MMVQRDNGIRPPPGYHFGDPGVTDDPTPRWLPALGLAIVLTLVAALARYAIDLLGIVFLIIVVGFSLRAVSDWLTEGDSVSVWSLVAVVAGLAGTMMVGTWLFGSTSLTSHLARPARMPPSVVRTIDWLEARGWGQRVLLREDPRQLPGAQGDAPVVAAGGDRVTAPVAGGGGFGDIELPRIRLQGRRSQGPDPGEAEAATIPSTRLSAGAARSSGGQQVAGTETTLRTSSSAVEVGTSIRLTATVRSLTGAGVPRGQVVFYNGTQVLGVVALEPGPGSAEATLSTRDVAPGRYALVAVYSGNDHFRSSRSSPVTQTVTTQ